MHWYELRIARKSLNHSSTASRGTPGTLGWGPFSRGKRGSVSLQNVKNNKIVDTPNTYNNWDHWRDGCYSRILYPVQLLYSIILRVTFQVTGLGFSLHVIRLSAKPSRLSRALHLLPFAEKRYPRRD